MGDGVNVAARLEALSHPGGVCISEAVYAQARDRLSLEFVDLGEHRVKNIARPVHAYRVPLASEEQVSVAISRSQRLRVRKRRPLLRPSSGDCCLRRTAGAAGCQRQGIPAHLRNERLRQVFSPASRAAAFHHSTRRSGWHRFLAPLPDPPLRRPRCGRLAGRWAASRRCPAGAGLRTGSAGSTLSQLRLIELSRSSARPSPRRRPRQVQPPHKPDWWWRSTRWRSCSRQRRSQHRAKCLCGSLRHSPAADWSG